MNAKFFSLVGIFLGEVLFSFFFRQLIQALFCPKEAQLGFFILLLDGADIKQFYIWSVLSFSPLPYREIKRDKTISKQLGLNPGLKHHNQPLEPLRPRLAAKLVPVGDKPFRDSWD